MKSLSPPPTRPPDSLRQAFSELMRLHHRELIVFAGAATRDREAARDIVQESFVAAWRSFEKYDDERDFGAWMRGIVRNKTKDWFRRHQREPIADSDLVDIEIDIAAWQAARYDGETVFQVVEACIKKLPANFEHAVRTYYFDEHNGEEAADALGISAANLRKRLQRARALLHDCISLHTHPRLQPQAKQSHV